MNVGKLRGRDDLDLIAEGVVAFAGVDNPYAIKLQILDGMSDRWGKARSIGSLAFDPVKPAALSQEQVQLYTIVIV